MPETYFKILNLLFPSKTIDGKDYKIIKYKKTITFHFP